MTIFDEFFVNLFQEYAFRYTASPININENLIGIKIENSLTEYSQLEHKEKEIKRIENELLSEKKQKKIDQLNSQLKDYKEEIIRRVGMVELVKMQLKQNVIYLKKLIENNSSDW